MSSDGDIRGSAARFTDVETEAYVMRFALSKINQLGM